ncbi:hypothetical protein [Saccharicrinis aurantiacus]|uniref:hypothetical protein n=1 Tax=Saccharicrinis aurantiacus TaxID=1849719 RepID=UPI00249042F5|nr:hypothetical protein [Saccharicrinis aurantiacus]
MKKKYFVFLCLALSIGVFAQEKQKEIGVVTSSFENFGLSYKFGSSKALWRIKTIYGNGFNMDSEYGPYEYYDYNTNEIIDKVNYQTSDSYSIGFAFGREYRVLITEDFEMRYGADLRYTYGNSKDIRNNSLNTDEKWVSKNIHNIMGVNFVFGFNYVFASNILLGVNINPYLVYRIGKSESGNEFDYEETKSSYVNTTLSYGLSTSSILLTLAYRF